ncbi:hypothetical protein ACIA8E_22560 [Streptomyces sp. NPDC051664]|uniref:hypothetical protein n=1 Tax=Streptomyces sp. NPDC051664 TaxID=3365668 RepID=UPI00378CC282
MRKLHLAQAGEGGDRRQGRKWSAPPDLTPLLVLPGLAVEVEFEYIGVHVLGPTGLRITR